MATELKDVLSMIDRRAAFLLEELGLAKPRLANEQEWENPVQQPHAGQENTADLSRAEVKQPAGARAKP
jgi:hypothetical protein